MPRRVDFTDMAEADLGVIRAWQLQQGAGAVAKRRVRAILAAIRRLQVDPCLHARGERPDTRELSVQAHRVVYAVVPDTGRSATAGDVIVLRVFSPGQSRQTDAPAI